MGPWGQTEFQVNLKLGLTPRSLGPLKRVVSLLGCPAGSGSVAVWHSYEDLCIFVCPWSTTTCSRDVGIPPGLWTIYDSCKSSEGLSGP